MTDDPILPPSGRWTAAAKEAVVLRLRRRQLTIAEACERFDLSVEEIDTWLARYKAGGQRAMRVRAIQHTYSPETGGRI